MRILCRQVPSRCKVSVTAMPGNAPWAGAMWCTAAAPLATAENLVYVIYTSGSTGTRPGRMTTILKGRSLCIATLPTSIYKAAGLHRLMQRMEHFAILRCFL